MKSETIRTVAGKRIKLVIERKLGDNCIMNKMFILGRNGKIIKKKRANKKAWMQFYENIENAAKPTPQDSPYNLAIDGRFPDYPMFSKEYNEWEKEQDKENKQWH